jgi:hypothetical protein
VERVGSLREELAVATGRPVHFNWFLRMDPQVAGSHGSPGWVVDRYGDCLEALRSAGDGIGLHPHAWRWAPARQRWVADHADADWVDECVRTSFETFEATLGETCRMVRFGDRFVSPRVVSLLARLGTRYDLTVEPGARSAVSLHPNTLATGLIPSMFRAPREPYRPSVEDPFRPANRLVVSDDAGLWMIPLTSVDPDPFLSMWRRMGRRVRQRQGPRYRPAPLLSRWPADAFWQLVERDLEKAPRPYLGFAIRSDSILRPALSRPVEEKLAALIATPLIRRLAFGTPDTVVGWDQAGVEAVSRPSG